MPDCQVLHVSEMSVHLFAVPGEWHEPPSLLPLLDQVSQGEVGLTLPLPLNTIKGLVTLLQGEAGESEMEVKGDIRVWMEAEKKVEGCRQVWKEAEKRW